MARTSEEEIRNLEAALRRNEKLALVGRIAASVMHEINNPAEAITNLVYLISTSADNPEMVRSLAGQVDEQLVRIQYAARQTLSFFRENPHRQNTDLVSVVETAVRFHMAALANKRIEVRKQMPSTLVASIYPGDFLQLVSNLLGNAIDAISDGGSLCMRMRASSSNIRLTIADNGCGISHALQSHLFEPFQTGKAENGNGLGLWICKSIADRHGGRISWRTNTTQEKHGTTFSVSLAS